MLLGIMQYNVLSGHGGGCSIYFQLFYYFDLVVVSPVFSAFV